MTALNVGMDKQITRHDQAFTTGNDLAIGEVATYTVVMTIPQGVTPEPRLVDTLPDGLAIVSLDSLTTSDPCTSGLGRQLSPNPRRRRPRRRTGPGATFQFGDITNTDTDPTRRPRPSRPSTGSSQLNVQANTNTRTQTNSAA